MDAEIFFLLIHTYIMQRRILKMYNKSKLTVTAKCLIGAKGVQTSLMVQLLISVSESVRLKSNSKLFPEKDASKTPLC